ncbi:hypothetical protein Dalu01_03084 [Deinococcus aluminii]|uniref:Transposase n=1 Tax=Deinococcus aluminii TaxID=1656885 RepID=A0ABP9XII2_9DEIO
MGKANEKTRKATLLTLFPVPVRAIVLPRLKRPYGTICAALTESFVRLVIPQPG